MSEVSFPSGMNSRAARRPRCTFGPPFIGRAAYRLQQRSSALTARVSLTSQDSHRTMLEDRDRSDVRRFLSPTEATLAEIWSELLEQGDIGPEDDFFELGGDSLLAVWLMEEIAERTGWHLPLSLLLEGATIRHLARAVDAQGAQPGMWRGINVHGTRCPLFWIHGWAELLSMRSYFDADQPVFQIQDPLARRWQVKPPLELSARRYVEELRRIQREGPYQLIGYSFGGVIAYEMARQLLASGERVNFRSEERRVGKECRSRGSREE